MWFNKGAGIDGYFVYRLHTPVNIIPPIQDFGYQAVTLNP